MIHIFIRAKFKDSKTEIGKKIWTNQKHFKAEKFRIKNKNTIVVFHLNIYLQRITWTPSMSSFVMQSDVRFEYITLHSSRVVLKYLISPMNHLLMKCPYPLMKYSQFLKSGVMLAINRYESFIKNKNKIRTFWGFLVSDTDKQRKSLIF